MDTSVAKPEPATSPAPAPLEAAMRPRPTYWLTRFVLLRMLGVVYFTAFLVAAQQAIPLIGHDGLLPADAYARRLERVFDEHPGEMRSFTERYLAGVRETCGDAVAQVLADLDELCHSQQKHLTGKTNMWLAMPSIFWWKISDGFILAMAWTGVALSAIVFCGFANSIMMLVLWALYMSFTNIGQLWFSYGWDMQLLETGFIAVFLCPLLDPRPFARSAPPVVALWVYRWMIFRIMVGAFLIKWRGDPSWRDLTALYYHYETQPVPNPLSRYLHFAPKWFQKFGVLWNHFVEIVVPWFAFWPGIARNIAGLLMMSFQIVLICSGNLSFLNWLTIVPCLACIDDSVWRRMLPGFVTRAAERAESEKKSSRAPVVAGIAFAVVVAVLSVPVVLNLFSKYQDMNNSYGPLELVNTYGAFGAMGKERHEIIFEGTDDPVPFDLTQWRAYEFKVKPGDPMRRPPFISPYHYRLDWQIWFQWFEGQPPPGGHPWPAYFIWKLLHNDPGTLSLLANNPFPDKPPANIRVILYRYKFAPLGNKDGAWWIRERVAQWLPPMSLKSTELRRYLEANHMLGTETE